MHPRRPDGGQGPQPVRGRAARGRRARAGRARPDRPPRPRRRRPGRTRRPRRAAGARRRRRARRRGGRRARPAPSSGSSPCPARASAGPRSACARPSSSSLLEGVAPDDPEAAGARAALPRRAGRGGRGRGRSAPTRPAPRASTRSPCGPSPPTPAPGRTCSRSRRCPTAFSYSQFDAYERCPLLYAFRHVYRIPTAGHRGRLHLRDHRPRRVRGLHEGAPRAGRPRRAAARPARTSTGSSRPSGSRPASPTGRPRRPTGAASARCSTTSGPASSPARAQALHEELAFELRLDPGDGSAVVRVVGSIDRIDRLPSGGIEVHRLQDRQDRAARRASTRASSSRSTPSPAATRSASARPSG